MTTIVVLCDPPRDGLVFPTLPNTSPLSSTEATELYRAVLTDICRAVAASGGELLVNYRPDEALPAHEGATAEAELRAVVRAALDDSDTARFERQVGDTFSGRAGNTATHLLEREQVASVAIVTPNAPLLSRQQIDAAAMKLRRSSVVLGPSTGGRVYYAGFAETIDYANAYADPVIETLTARALDAGHEVDFLPMQPVIASGRNLAGLLSMLRARQRASRNVPEHTSAFFDDHDIAVTDGDEGVTLTR